MKCTVCLRECSEYNKTYQDCEHCRDNNFLRVKLCTNCTKEKVEKALILFLLKIKSMEYNNSVSTNLIIKYANEYFGDLK